MVHHPKQPSWRVKVLDIMWSEDEVSKNDSAIASQPNTPLKNPHRNNNSERDDGLKSPHWPDPDRVGLGVTPRLAIKK
jgi:hypothetical protein